MNQVEYLEMAAASSGLAPSVSRKSLRAEFLNYVAIIPDDQLGEGMAVSKPAVTERCEHCSYNPKTLHSQYAGTSLCENKLTMITFCVLLPPVLVLLATLSMSSSG